MAERSSRQRVISFLAQTPSPTPSVIQAPPADTLQTVGAVIAILLAVVAGVIGYRIIRGGRGL